MSDLPDEVMDRAVEAGTKAIDGFKWPSARICADEVIKAAAPVIADAAYRQGREDLEARIEELAARWEADGMSGYITKPLRSLLTDKEEA